MIDKQNLGGMHASEMERGQEEGVAVHLVHRRRRAPLRQNPPTKQPATSTNFDILMEEGNDDNGFHDHGD